MTAYGPSATSEAIRFSVNVGGQTDIDGYFFNSIDPKQTIVIAAVGMAWDMRRVVALTHDHQNFFRTSNN
ncbi:hypothetical protein C7G41_34955 [Bradyrhizobium sp. MOS002]|nr:hypothetical protein C7G41_34955 [Bradyrhizobium sp. MOS002]